MQFCILLVTRAAQVFIIHMMSRPLKTSHYFPLSLHTRNIFGTLQTFCKTETHKKLEHTGCAQHKRETYIFKNFRTYIKRNYLRNKKQFSSSFKRRKNTERGLTHRDHFTSCSSDCRTLQFAARFIISCRGV